MPVLYTDDEKVFAKSLAIAKGSPTIAWRMLNEMWGEERRVPDRSQLVRWRNDASIREDWDLIEQIQRDSRNEVIAQATTLSRAAAERMQELWEDRESSLKDIQHGMIGWGIAADKLTGGKYSPGLQINNPQGGNVFVTFAAAPEQRREERQINVESLSIDA